MAKFVGRGSETDNIDSNSLWAPFPPDIHLCRLNGNEPQFPQPFSGSHRVYLYRRHFHEAVFLTDPGGLLLLHDASFLDDEVTLTAR